MSGRDAPDASSEEAPAGGQGSGGADGAPDASAVAAGVVAWFRPRSRDVPWRGEDDPYRIWVAEVMAQQTRISTVRQYYGPFLERFPDVEALAGAELDDVLKQWEGLGYYARARRLHRAAREVVETYDGELPGDADRLQELPGVGPYTAGAVASLAFGRPEPAVDGNTRRVLCRVYDLEDPSAADLEARARSLLDTPEADDPAAVNQALMDLGGEICTPADPSCDICPLERQCLARARGTVDRRPPSRPSRTLPHHDIAVGLVWDGRGRLLIARRPPEGLLGGLWEFPGGKVEAGEEREAAVRRELEEEMGIRVEVGRRLARVEHAYSHFRITLHAYHARRVGGEPRARSATAWAWVAPRELDDYAFPAANIRIIEKLREEGRAGFRAG